MKINQSKNEAGSVQDEYEDTCSDGGFTDSVLTSVSRINK